MGPENHRWVVGDQFGLAFPADPAGLRSGGTRFLTDAFRVAGVLGGDNSVTRSRNSVRSPAAVRVAKSLWRSDTTRLWRACTPTCSSSSPATWTTRYVIAEGRKWSRKCGSPRCHECPSFP